MSDDNLSKAELQLIDKIVDVLSLTKFRHLLWDKIRQAFGLSFQGTQLEYGFVRGVPDPLALKYLEDRVFILSDKTQSLLRGNLRWELLEGMKNVESVDEIKRRLDKIFEGNTVQTERIARTEVLNAQNAGRLSAYEASDVVHYKMWKAAMNNARTAADSKRLNGQIQKVGDSFIDPKTGDANMHPPNRPFCRCTMIPLRKLPENIVYKGGQMYDANEMVGKIEIDIGSLSKTEKHYEYITVHPKKGKPFKRRQLVGKKDVEGKSKDIIIDETNNLNKIGIQKIKSAVKSSGITDKVRIVSESSIKDIMGIKHPEKSTSPLSWYDDNKHEYVLNGKVFNEDLKDFEKYMRYSTSKNWNKKGSNLKTVLLHERGHQIARPDTFNIGYVNKDFQKAVESFYVKYGGQDGVKQEVGNYAGTSITEVLPEAYALTYSGVDVSDDVKALGKLVKDFELKGAEV